MSTDAETKIKSVINARTGVPIHRFPENLGSPAKEPEARKFCLFEFITIRGGNQKLVLV